MAYAPIAGYALQTMTQAGEVAEGYYLKFYEANTTTPLSMATDATGSTLLVKAKLNDNGMPISNPLDNSTEFIPHMNAAYRLVIYLNETDADNNTTASALVNIASVRAPQGISVGVQDCTATFVSNVYTVTPTNSSFVALEEGLIIEFDLPDSSVTTGQAQINYNGTTDDLDWIDGSATASDDLDADYTKRIRCRFDGTDWRIISDVAGNNSNGDWERRADGVQICYATESTTISSALTGILTFTLPKPFISSTYSSQAQTDTTVGGNAWTSYQVSKTTGSATVTYIDISKVARSGTLTGSTLNTGRWY